MTTARLPDPADGLGRQHRDVRSVPTRACNDEGPDLSARSCSLAEVDDVKRLPSLDEA
jgi:hypothetical protein